MATDLSPLLPAADLPEGQGRNWLDVQGLASLKAEAGANAASALHKVAEQFESLFLGMMLKSMRDAKLSEGAFDSDATKFYQDLYDEQLSVALSHGKGLGIAAMLEKSLAPHAPTARPGTTPGPFAPGPGRAPVSRSAAAIAAVAAGLRAADGEVTAPAAAPAEEAPASPGASRTLAATPEAFVEMVMPHAVAAGASLGVSPLVLVAQAALETRWGQHVPGADEGSSYNLFGIKADPAWTGRRVAKDTLEYQDGIAVRRREPFRAYESLEHGFADFVNFLKSHARYAGALASGADPGRYTDALQKAGYATDPSYAAKINAILGSDTLRRAISALKILPALPIP